MHAACSQCLCPVLGSGVYRGLQGDAFHVFPVLVPSAWCRGLQEFTGRAHHVFLVLVPSAWVRRLQELTGRTPAGGPEVPAP